MIQDHVTSLDLSKQLYEAGIVVESEFWWSKAMDNKLWRVENRHFFKVDRRRDIPAPLSSELGELLPWCVNRGSEMPWYLTCRKVIQTVDQDEWQITYERSRDGFIISDFADTEANARANMLLYLKEKELL